MSSGPESTAPSRDFAAEWQRIEMGWVDTDLPVWRSLAEEFGGPVVELGSGIGRVSLDLGSSGYRVVGVERSEEMSSHLRAAALARDLDLTVLNACVEDLESEWRTARASGPIPDFVGLVIAPMQFTNLLSELQLSSTLEFVTSGEIGYPVLALAVLADPPSPGWGAYVPPGLPDLADRDGMIFSSRISKVSWKAERLMISRERQVVAPDGEISTSWTSELVRWVSAESLSSQLADFGYLLERDELLPAEPGSMDSRLLVFRYGGAR